MAHTGDFEVCDVGTRARLRTLELALRHARSEIICLSGGNYHRPGTKLLIDRLARLLPESAAGGVA